MGESTEEVINKVIEIMKKEACKVPNGSIAYILPSPNKGKMLLVHKDELIAAMKIWEGKATADDFDFVEEIKLPKLRKLHIRKQIKE